MQTTTEIPRDGWNKFFTRFNHDHDMQLVAVEILGRDIGAQTEGRSLLLGGISAGNETSDSLVMMFDTLDGEHVTHMVDKPVHVWLQRAPDDSDEALQIESADGTKTLVRFPRAQTSEDVEREFTAPDDLPS
jgi:hypothetical protein